MPGIATDLVVYNLGLKDYAKTIKKKLRKMNPNIALMVKEELQKLLQAKFVEPIDYSYWISNMVPVKKPNGKICICTDFRDLNKACPKDDFPLPNIDTLVDATTGHEMLSLMDGFFGYNQIKVAPQDQHKTTFITPWGTFCYKVMPYGLKNDGETYQRAMTYIFHDYMHDILEDYVDDLLAKSKTRKQHPEILIKIFDRLLQFNVCLNPKKCVFGVTLGKLLGFIVSQRGIEIDPNKIKAITHMPSPSNIKQLQSLQGKLQSIRRFISQLSDKCKPFTKLLKKGVVFHWGKEQEEALDEIKKYLLTPPVLSPP